MKATRAYIASMGTAAVMLGASLTLFAFVGTLMSFGAWPGLDAHEKVDAVLVESVSARTAEPVRVDARPRAAVDRVRDAARQAALTPASGPRLATPVTRAPAAAPAPAAPAPSAGGGGTVAAPQVVTEPVQRPLERTTGELNRTVETVTQQTGEIVGQVEQQVQGPLQESRGTVEGLLR